MQSYEYFGTFANITAEIRLFRPLIVLQAYCLTLVCGNSHCDMEAITGVIGYLLMWY